MSELTMTRINNLPNIGAWSLRNSTANPLVSDEGKEIHKICTDLGRYDLGRYIEESRLSWKPKLRDTVIHLSNECREVGWDGYDARPIDPMLKSTTIRVINFLPDNIEPPEVTPEADGGFALDWCNSNGDVMLSVGVGFDELVYACSAKENKNHGRVLFVYEMPKDVTDLIERYFKIET